MLAEGGLISVIMPVYNREAVVSQSIDAVLNQTYSNLELVIVDDCSTDSTPQILEEIASKDSRVRIIRHETNMGAAKTRITAARACHGDFIALIDSDDLWTADKLMKQVNCQKETNADAIYSASAYIQEDGKPVDYVFHVPTSVTYKELLKQNIMSNSSVMVRKDLFLQYAKADSGVHEDFVCWLSILKSGYKCVGIDEPLMTFRLTEKSITTNKYHSALMTWNTYRMMNHNVFSSFYYMVCYTLRSLKKYKNIPN